MLTLHHAPATAGLVAHWLLIELGLPHRLHAQRMKARPSWQELCRREGLTDWV